MARSDDGEQPSVVAHLLSTDDEVGRDLARVDWANTPLGPPQTWPQSLQTAVGIMLSSQFSMWLAWGAELTFFCNAAYRRDTLGRKYPWALGRPAREVWAEIWDDIGPRIETVLTTGKSTWDAALLLFLERSGYLEETYHTFSYSPLHDAGAVVGFLCVVSEDTDRVIGERRMATLSDLGADPSVIRSERETLAYAGAQLGRNLRDLPFTSTYLFQDDGSARLASTTGLPAGHPAAPETLAVRDDIWPAAAAARGETTQVTLGLTGLPPGDWTLPPISALVVPLLQQGGAPYGFLVAGLNRYRPLDEHYRGFVTLVAGHLAAGIGSARSYATQQSRAEELAELDRAKTMFFSNISHEFRTPLTLIMGPVDELRARLAPFDPVAGEQLTVVHRNALRLGKLVNTLLDFSRIEAGRMEARFEPVDLSAVTSELASVFRSAIERAGLTFDVDCPPLPEPVHLDRGMWEKVILNLLSNALKFTFDGSITVTTRAEDKAAVVTVTDTGIGVAPAEMPRLFERFHRISNARSRSNEGSGIGLALVRELVGLHGGAITADSETGVGTRFTIRLPLGTAHLPVDAVEMAATAPAAVSATAAPYVQEALRWLPGDVDRSVPNEATVPAPRTPATVLVADDNADMRDYLTRLLSGAGYQVRAAADGEDALAQIRGEIPDLVVSDVMMPRLDGLELVAALRADSRTAVVPVLLLSARAGQEASIDGLRAGADDYLVKPFTASELLARVRANIELSQLRNHHARWRAALIDSLHEAFFLCDDTGAVIEINTAFTDILGYGAEELPYGRPHPWWPPLDVDPDAHRQVAEAFDTMLGQSQGQFTVPVVHRDGHRLWINATYNKARDPDTEYTVVVGTFRDVTAEHYRVKRDGAVAALGVRLSEAASLSDASAAALSAIKDIWRAESVLSAVFVDGAEPPTLTGTDPGTWSWDDLTAQHRAVFATLRERTPLSPVVHDTGAGITLDHPDGLLALWIDFGEHRPFAEQDDVLLSLLAGHLTQGLARARQIDQQRETALALQRAILGPSRLPGGFAVRYQPAARPLQVGGDWYDTVTLPDGRIGIVVGDCVGRGLDAAAVMGQLRSACGALLLQLGDPADTLMALDRFAAEVTGAVCTTVFCGTLDPETGRLSYSSAGHPPAILARPDGSTELLDGARSIPLAVRPGIRRPRAEHTVPARGTVLMYTDGLIERRRRPLDEGIDRARETLRTGGDLTLDGLATEMMERLAPADGYDDDVAVLLYRHPAPLELTFAAETTQVAPVRAALRDWLSHCELPSHIIQDVLVAVGEACANAIEHAYRDTANAFVRLRAEVLAADLRLTVTDSGRWQPPQRNPLRGRGIALMRATMRDVTITGGAAGTVVELRSGTFR